MTTILAPTILTSIASNSPRLDTQRWTAPKFIHQESLRHRKVYIMDFLNSEFDADFSFSVSSSRAIPFNRLLAEVRSDETRAAPVVWGKEKKGMSLGDELDDTIANIYWRGVIENLTTIDPTGLISPWNFKQDVDQMITERECARRLWALEVQVASAFAEVMAETTGVHKSIVNRMIEHGVHVHCLASATELGWMNFFGLRLDSAADPTLRALAEASWISYNESKPKILEPGEWHLPFVDEQYLDELQLIDRGIEAGELDPNDYKCQSMLELAISTACSAHLSYESFDNPGFRMPISKCIELHNRFVNSRPLHASPMEHQATPDTQSQKLVQSINTDTGCYSYLFDHPEQAGNFGPGWRQYRKMIPGENLAPLPEG